jgi:DNA replication protein DnaC
MPSTWCGSSQGPSLIANLKRVDGNGCPARRFLMAVNAYCLLIVDEIGYLTEPRLRSRCTISR